MSTDTFATTRETWVAAMETLSTWVRSITEEGENVNPYAEILPGDPSAPVHSLAMTFQEPSRSKLGNFYEIHGRSGLIVLIRGSLQVLLEGMPLSLTAGQAFLHLPFQTHFFLRESEDALICAINFESLPGADSWRELRGRVFAMPAGWEERHIAIIRHWKEGRGEEAANALYRQLLATVAWNREHPLDASPYTWLIPLMELLAHPGNLRLRVKELADRLGLAPNYLTAAFKTAFGVPLGSWLEHRRFGTALTLLTQPDVSIGDIARVTGFYSASAFSRKMRGWCGMTPGQCREVLQSEQPQIRFTPFGQAIRPNV